MTRPERIQKLANAIKEFRGAYDSRTGKWIRTPKPHAITRVYKWLDALGLPASDIEKIQGFKTLDEFHVYIRAIK